MYMYFTIYKQYLLLKIWTIFMNILYNSLKSEGTKDHFRRVRVLVPPLIYRPGYKLILSA